MGLSNSNNVCVWSARCGLELLPPLQKELPAPVPNAKFSESSPPVITEETKENWNIQPSLPVSK